MDVSEGYDVLRLIEHGKGCYVSSEYVKGLPLIRWMKFHPILPKEQLFFWLHELARQLHCIHKCGGNPCYKYVNPYSIIVTEEKKLYFLDMSAKSNEKQLHLMRRRNVREHFLPAEEAYYQTESIALDIYGLGKTIQYLLSISEPEPSLTKREERKLKNLIVRTTDRESKRAYKNVSDLRRQMPVYRLSEKFRKSILYQFKHWTLIIGIIFCGIIGFCALKDTLKESVSNENEEMSETPSSEENNQSQKERELLKELGFLFFTELEDYEKSRDYFSQITNDTAADAMVLLMTYMLDENEITKKELRTALEQAEKLIEEKEKARYYFCFIEGYSLLGEGEDMEKIISLAEYCKGQMKDTDIQKELLAHMAPAYEQTDNLEQAIESYTKLLEMTEEKNEREELYKKIVLLHENNGMKDKAQETCRKGVDELSDSVDLRIYHIRMQCADHAIEREVCAQTIKEYIEELPIIKDEQEFQKIVQEYGITIEGENVWVGR